MKYKIEKNTVQETLIIPLYARKVCSELYPNLYRDETAVRLIDEIDYDFSEAEKNSRGLMQRFGSLEVAMRQNDLAFEVRDYLKSHPNAAVVNLGCGLDSTGRSCDNGSCNIYNLDFPDVIAVRNELLPAGKREESIPCDLNNTEWFPQINGLHWRRPNKRHAVGDCVLQRDDGHFKRVDVTGRRAPQRARRLSTRARLQLVDALGADNRQLGHAVGKAILAQLLQVRAVFVVKPQHHRPGAAE